MNQERLALLKLGHEFGVAWEELLAWARDAAAWLEDAPPASGAPADAPVELASASASAMLSEPPATPRRRAVLWTEERRQQQAERMRLQRADGKIVGGLGCLPKVARDACVCEVCYGALPPSRKGKTCGDECFAELTRRHAKARWAAFRAADEIPAPAAVVDPEPKPPEAQPQGAVDGAGSSSETNAGLIQGGGNPGANVSAGVTAGETAPETEIEPAAQGPSGSTQIGRPATANLAPPKPADSAKFPTMVSGARRPDTIEDVLHWRKYCGDQVKPAGAGLWTINGSTAVATAELIRRTNNLRRSNGGRPFDIAVELEPKLHPEAAE